MSKGFGKLIDGQVCFIKNTLSHPSGTFQVDDYDSETTILPDGWRFFENEDVAAVYFSQPIDVVAKDNNGVPLQATMLTLMGVLDALGKYGDLKAYLDAPTTPEFHKDAFDKFGPNDKVSRTSPLTQLIGGVLQVDMDQVYLATLQAEV